MSQVSLIDIEGSNPQIPTEFVADIGSAIPLANVLEILGTSVVAGITPVKTTGSGNTITVEVQTSQAVAASDATKIGLANFDSSTFGVDANGFVTLVAGGGGITDINVDASTAPGTDPVVQALGVITMTGAQVAAGVVGTNVIRTDSLAANSITLEIQRSSAVGASAPINNGVSHFNAAQFSVDADGFVSLGGGGLAVDSLGVQATSGAGTDPVLPTVGGIIEFEGGTVVAGTNPVRAVSTAANTVQIQNQISQALAAQDATKIGLSNFDSSMFTVDANGFVTLNASASFTTGSVIFWGASSFAQDNPNFFYDDTNNRLGLGITTPLDTLHVVGAMQLDHVATENDDHAIEIVANANGFSDVKAIDIDYITGTMGAGQYEEAILVNIDETASTGGIVAGYLVLTTAEGSATINGYETGINVNPIVQQSGTFGNADYIRNIAVDVTAALASGGVGGVTAFVADNDTFTIGEPASFDEIEVILTTPASGAGIAPTFEYSTGAATFASFVPADGTNGFRNTGAILWDSSTLAGWVAAASGNFEIRITRTRNVLATSPVIDEIQVSATTEFKWDKNGDVNINSLTLVVPLTVPNGGTGNSSLTDHGIMLGSGAGAVTVTAAPTNGQLLIGSTGVDPVLGSLTSTGGSVTITPGAGTINLEVAASNDAILTVTGDSGGALSPTAGNLNVLGTSGSKTSGSASTLTVKSPPYADIAAPTSVTLNSGTFATATITLTTPITAGLANGDLLEFVATNGVLVIQLAATQVAHLGSAATSVAGLISGTATGDSISLRYQASSNDWWATSSIGIWNLT